MIKKYEKQQIQMDIYDEIVFLTFENQGDLNKVISLMEEGIEEIQESNIIPSYKKYIIKSMKKFLRKMKK